MLASAAGRASSGPPALRTLDRGPPQRWPLQHWLRQRRRGGSGGGAGGGSDLACRTEQPGRLHLGGLLAFQPSSPGSANGSEGGSSSSEYLAEYVAAGAGGEVHGYPKFGGVLAGSGSGGGRPSLPTDTFQQLRQAVLSSLDIADNAEHTVDYEDGGLEEGEGIALESCPSVKEVGKSVFEVGAGAGPVGGGCRVERAGAGPCAWLPQPPQMVAAEGGTRGGERGQRALAAAAAHPACPPAPARPCLPRRRRCASTRRARRGGCTCGDETSSAHTACSRATCAASTPRSGALPAPACARPALERPPARCCARPAAARHRAPSRPPLRWLTTPACPPACLPARAPAQPHQGVTQRDDQGGMRAAQHWRGAGGGHGRQVPAV